MALTYVIPKQPQNSAEISKDFLAQTNDAAAPSPLTIQAPRVRACREGGNLCIHLFCAAPHFLCNSWSFFLLEASEDKCVQTRTENNKK
jgi:hypothetical protein